MDAKVDPTVWGLAIATIIVLGSINAYFVSRLVKKIEESSLTIISLKSDVNNIKQQMTELSDLSHRTIELEKKLAVLEYRVANKRQQIKSNDTSC